ncbi:MAG: hypothetical protein HS111_04450 [Kofleriaceae bacterium]|nr:hypothetical protein [Kofleriaceae bacterium]
MRRTSTRALLALALMWSLGRAPAAAQTVVEPLPPEPDDAAEIVVEPLPAGDDGAGGPAGEGEGAGGEGEGEGEGGAASLFEEMTPERRAEYAAALREVVAAVRGKVTEKIADKIASKQNDRMAQIAAVLSLVSLGGLLLLGAPLVLRRRFPGQGAVLWKYSALAAVMFVLAVNLFTGVLLLMRGSQAVMGQATNPQLQVVESTFDLMYDKAPDLAEIGPVLIEPTLVGLTGESEEPVLTIMLENVQKLRSDFTVFTTVGTFFKRLDWLFGLLPIVMIGLAMLLFARAAWPTLAEIVRLPGRAASGEAGAGRRVVALTLRNVWAELRATLAVIGVLFVLTVLAGILVGLVLAPAIEIFLAYLTVSLMYVQVVDQASSFWVLFSLMASIVFLAANLGVVLVTTAFFLGTSQKLFQARFREGVPLGQHRRFWLWGSVAVVWALVLPVLYILVAQEGVAWLAGKMIATGSWPLVLGGGPALFLLGFAVVFWAARGARGLGFIKRYRPAPPPPTAPAGYGLMAAPGTR